MGLASRGLCGSLVGCVLTLAVASALTGCNNTETPDNSMQAIMEQRLARESLPGKAHYQRACASCHEGQVKKAPHREMLGLLTPEAVLGTMNEGLMQLQATTLSAQEREEVAEYIGGRPLGSAGSADLPQCDASVSLSLEAITDPQGWGLGEGNVRAIEASVAQLDAAALKSLAPQWAIAFPGANRARSQPLLAGGLIFVGSHGGSVYALDEDSGCQVWRYEAAAEVSYWLCTCGRHQRRHGAGIVLRRCAWQRLSARCR